ncbi:MAG TPA: hypothetical protein VJQ47_11020 [Steroidobacteraceae bacterium]|nr:hypothetical protein [Steroidobacteraceae bacterium]
MKALLALTAITALTMAPAYADCSYPAAPDKLPDGNSATKEEMIAGQKLVKEYNTAMTSYLECLKLEHPPIADAAPNATPEEKKAQAQRVQQLQDQKYNAAVDQLHSIADRFNEQVRVFNSRKDKSKG